jgi:hypothetical protein
MKEPQNWNHKDHEEHKDVFVIFVVFVVRKTNVCSHR